MNEIELAELKNLAEMGKLQDVTALLLAHIDKVERSIMSKVHAPPEIIGDQSVYAHRSTNYDGKSEVRIGIYGTRRTVMDPGELSDDLTVPELIAHIRRLTSTVKDLKQSLHERQFIY